MVEKFTNFARSSVVSDITAGATTLVVEYATNFPTSGDFRLRCGNELMLCTGVSGTTFTVTRGVEGTTAAAHAAGTPIAHVMTAGSLALAAGYISGPLYLTGEFTSTESFSGVLDMPDGMGVYLWTSN
jgi:hypothetical protein